MENPMITYIKEQPQALKRIFDGRKAGTAAFTNAVVKARPTRIYLLASGTSFNAAAVAAPFMQHVLGIEVTALPASRLPGVPSAVASPMFCFVSQGGRSTNTIAAIERYKQYPTVVVTADAQSVIAKRYAPLHMLLNCGPEKAGPKTKGYTSSILTFYTAALEAALALGSVTPAAYEDYTAKMESVIAKMAGNIEKTFAWYNAKEATLAGMKKFVFFGKDVGAQTSLEAALKVLETVKHPAMGFEFEEYLHGPIMMADDTLFLMGFISPDADGKRMADLLAYYTKHTPCSYSVCKDGDLALDICCDQFFAPFAHILPAQVISALLPAHMGREDSSMGIFHEVNAIVGTKAKEQL